MPTSLAGFDPQRSPSADVLTERVGELKTLAANIAARLDKLTLTSKLAPWAIFPGCFYSKQLVCTTYTDCTGYFECCFKWYPWHLRHGRLRFDRRPDIVVKVTQTINGVDHVIYMDPYTSTRWNVTNAHIDLFLDDEEVVCGQGCPGDPLPGEQHASILRIGADPVFHIDQSTGKFHVPATDNAAYGGGLYVFGGFSEDLMGVGAQKNYYRLSFAKANPDGSTPPDASFTPIRTLYEALRAPIIGSFADYLIGPKTVNGTPDLYEVMDTEHWWMTTGMTALTTPGGMLLALWDTSKETDEGLWILRMEVFDWQGVKRIAVQFPNHGGNGTGADPDPVPVVPDHLDQKVHIDNKLMTYELETPATNTCGVIPWSVAMAPGFEVQVNAQQENGRVHSWRLHYVRGVDPTERPAPPVPGWTASYNTGVGSVNQSVSAAPLLVDPSTPSGQLEGTCAFAFNLDAWSHVRGNAGFMYYGRKTYAVVIERCECPECD